MVIFFIIFFVSCGQETPPNKYFYVLFCYEYSLEGYDYCKFNTVGFETDIIESNKIYATN